MLDVLLQNDGTTVAQGQSSVNPGLFHRCNALTMVGREALEVFYEHAQPRDPVVGLLPLFGDAGCLDVACKDEMRLPTSIQNKVAETKQGDKPDVCAENDEEPNLL